MRYAVLFLSALLAVLIGIGVAAAYTYYHLESIPSWGVVIIAALLWLYAHIISIAYYHIRAKMLEHEKCGG